MKGPAVLAIGGTPHAPTRPNPEPDVPAPDPADAPDEPPQDDGDAEEKRPGRTVRR